MTKKKSSGVYVCKGCAKPLGKTLPRIQCSGGCKSWVHATKKCTSIEEKQLLPFIEKKAPWTCETCCTSGEDSEENSSVEESSDEGEEAEPPRKSPKNKRGNVRTSHSGDSSDSKLELIVKQNNEILNKLNKIERENKQLKAELKALKSENSEIRKEIDLLKNQREYYRQDTLKNNIIISGIPMKESTDKDELNKLVISIAKRLDVNITDGDITCYKVGKNEPKQLKVKFADADKKNLIMKNKKVLVLNTKQIGFSEDKIIYINHDMTLRNQLLLKRARECKRGGAIKYAWYKDGKVLVRKDEDSPTVRIKTEDDLLQFQKN